jgi:hypothetical protein
MIQKESRQYRVNPHSRGTGPLSSKL